MSFPDIEDVVRRHLLSVAFEKGASVHTRVPNERPENFIRVWRSGGAAINRVLDEPLITIESYGEDDKVASDNATIARSVLLAASATIPLVRGVNDRSGIYYDPDPVSDAPRYTCTLELRVRRGRPT